MKPLIYLDYNATTPVDPKVFEAMKPFFCEKFGNAASGSHSYGWTALEAVDSARQSIAKLIGSSNKESIIFTSGATESNNMALKGVVHGSGLKKAHLITQKTEHKCVLNSCAELELLGHEVTYLDVDSFGLVKPHDVLKSIKENTLLCSIMAANNEIGTCQPLSQIAKMCREKGVLFHTDAVQTVGKIPMNVETEGIDLMSLSAHKIYGPKGVGALYMARRSPPIPFKPLLHGGGHEEGKRSGTLNVPGIVGLAAALRICVENIKEESLRLSHLRDSFIERVLTSIPHSYLNGHPSLRIPNNVSLRFDYISADDLLADLPKIAFSTGSACSSNSTEPSYVVKALGFTDDEVRSTVRFGLGRWTTKEEIDMTFDKLKQSIEKLRLKSLKYEMARVNYPSLKKEK